MTGSSERDTDKRTVVVTGGAGGIGRAIVERLATDDYGVVVLEAVKTTPDWLGRLVDAGSAQLVVGDAGDDAVAARAAGTAEALGPLAGWVNNAAVFRDAWLHEAGGTATAELVGRNLRPALAGSAAAVGAFGRSGTAGSIVNVSSHQAQRPVSGALPYSTAKAAIEGLTRSLAVDYGPCGIRANAVALGSVATERLDSFGSERSEMDEHLRRLHPLGRVGLASEVADVVAFLLSERSSFVSGAVIPVDGARSVSGPDPESRTLD